MNPQLGGGAWASPLFLLRVLSLFPTVALLRDVQLAMCTLSLFICLFVFVTAILIVS